MKLCPTHRQLPIAKPGDSCIVCQAEALGRLIRDADSQNWMVTTQEWEAFKWAACSLAEATQ